MLPNVEYLQDFAVRYSAAWCSHQPDNVASYYSPNGSLTINGGVPAVGRTAITDSAQSFMTAFPDLQVVMDELVMREDRAEYHWTLMGTNTGGPGSTGNRVRISGFEVWEMGADGLIAASLGHFDAADFQRQLEQGVNRR